jgi:hypothetical protein
MGYFLQTKKFLNEFKVFKSIVIESIKYQAVKINYLILSIKLILMKGGIYLRMNFYPLKEKKT